MLEVILDTETTGLSTKEKHRVVEIGCVELSNLIPTNKIFHQYINPQRKVSEDAYKVHGYSDKFLADKKTFSQIAKDFLPFFKPLPTSLSFCTVVAYAIIFFAGPNKLISIV